jgi:TonB family protein
MITSALRSEECNPSPSDIGTAPALEVRASYNGVLIGTRLLAAAERLRPVRGQGVQDARMNYTIGQSPSADAPAASEVLGATDLPLVTRWGAGFLVNVTPRMTGDVAVGGKVYRLADYLAGRGSNFTLPADGRARIDCGAMSFQLAHTTRPIPLPRRFFAWRWAEQKFNVGAFLALGIFLLTICAIPPEGESVSSDFAVMSRRFIPFTVTAPESAQVPEFLTKQPNKGQGEAGKALAGESGRMGNNHSKRPTGGYTSKGNGRDQHLGKAAAEARIRTMGILGVLNAAANSPFASILGRGSAVGDAQDDIMGNLLAANIGDGFGAGGFGVLGTGNGGGGTGRWTIGTGNLNTLGGKGYGTNPGGGELRRHIPRPPGVILGVLTAKGSLDKDIIRRVVHLHMNEIKYCYDQELVRKADLEGRISVQFIIAGTGQVINSVVQSSTMNNVRVEGCVVSAVKRWDFPKPTGGGIAIVSYPFNFVAGAGN